MNGPGESSCFLDRLRMTSGVAYRPFRGLIGCSNRFLLFFRCLGQQNLDSNLANEMMFLIIYLSSKKSSPEALLFGWRLKYYLEATCSANDYVIGSQKNQHVTSRLIILSFGHYGV